MMGFDHKTIFFTREAIIVFYFTHCLIFYTTDRIPNMKRSDWQKKQSVPDVNYSDFLCGVRTSPRFILSVGNNNVRNNRRHRT